MWGASYTQRHTVTHNLCQFNCECKTMLLLLKKSFESLNVLWQKVFCPRRRRLHRPLANIIRTEAKLLNCDLPSAPGTSKVHVRTQ